ncbi:MAG TPA: GIY-YIG nuclease family protein [Casimicrobium sp.]|nr:GIY-YIG nuclease family protein [Casimicrobium sp.]
MNCAVHLLASQRNGTRYTGVTSDLVKRVYEHKHDLADGFTRRYGVKMLVWYELTTDIGSAIQREKQIKKWNRLWKLRLVDQNNPEWRDLYSHIVG